MYWSIKTGKLREKFEISADELNVYFDNCASDGNQISLTSHFWLKPDIAREIAQALISAADFCERKKNAKT